MMSIVMALWTRQSLWHPLNCRAMPSKQTQMAAAVSKEDFIYGAGWIRPALVVCQPCFVPTNSKFCFSDQMREHHLENAERYGFLGLTFRVLMNGLELFKSS